MQTDTSNSQPQFSAIILAGGNSTRMKFPKPWLKIDTTTFLEKIIKTYQNFGIQKIILIINQKFLDVADSLSIHSAIIEKMDLGASMMLS